MELRQLKYFVKVGKLQSYSLASKSLFITQSTISQQIRKLEEELGVELLTRDTRHVALSDYGKQFYPSAVRVLEEAKAGAERIMDVKNLQVGELSVGCTYSFSPMMMRTVLPFYRQYPHIKLNLTITTKEVLRQKLLNRELDLALTYKSPIGDEHIDSSLLFHSRLCLVGRIGELTGCRPTVSVEELSKFPLALPAKGLQARDTLESIIYAEHVNLDIRLEINSVRVLLDIVENSPLVTTVSEEAIHHIQGFEAVPIDHPDARMDGCYHYLKGSYRKKSAGEFLRILTENNAFEKAMERF